MKGESRRKKEALPTYLKKALGVFFIVVGLVALFSPFTPGSWLIFVGLQFFGLRLLFIDKLKGVFIKKK